MTRKRGGGKKFALLSSLGWPRLAPAGFGRLVGKSFLCPMVSNGVRLCPSSVAALMSGRRGSAAPAEQTVFGPDWSGYSGLLRLARGEKFEGFIWLD